MELKQEYLPVLEQVGRHMRNFVAIPEESHVFLALIKEADNPLDIMESCPPQYLDLSTINNDMREFFKNGAQWNFLLRAACCPSTPPSFSTAETGAISKNGKLFFAADTGELSRQMSERTVKVRKGEIMTCITDSFRKFCIASGNNEIAKIHNRILQPTLYRAFYSRLPKMDGIMAGRYVYAPQIFLNKAETAALTATVKEWDSNLANATPEIKEMARDMFKNTFGKQEVAIYNVATKLWK